jgi:8-hydroxy-5-deazaflavin:NADPH oxidoreductase
MKIAVVGRGNVGGGLADLWAKAGHEVTRIGKGGGDVSGAEAVLVAVPGGAVADALERVQGLEGKTVIDATNLVGVEPPSGFASNAEFVRSKTNGPTAKSFNLNFARSYGRLGETKATPSNLWSGAWRRPTSCELTKRSRRRVTRAPSREYPTVGASTGKFARRDAGCPS